jgi:hypothetical protein
MLMLDHLVFGFDQTFCLFVFPFGIVYFDLQGLNYKCQNPLRGSQPPKSKEKTKNDKRKTQKMDNNPTNVHTLLSYRWNK